MTQCTVDGQDLYPSRQGDCPEVLERHDPVVYSAEGGGDDIEPSLSARQVEDYDRQGFVVLENFFSSAEVESCQRELRRLAESESVKRRPEAIIEPERNALRSLFSVHTISPFFRGVAGDRRLVNAARQLLGSDVYMHQSRVNLKPGFAGKEFYWHSDFETWHVEDGMPRMRALSCSILLTANHEWNGPLMLVPGSHRKFVACVGETPENHYQQSLRRQEYGVPDQESLTRLVREGGLESVTGPAGTVVLFDCNTMHGSNGNITPYPRSNLFFVFNSVLNRLQAPYCGLKPRPEFIAAREQCEVLTPREFDRALLCSVTDSLADDPPGAGPGSVVQTRR